MGEVWTQLEGQLVNGIYPLRRFLNASDHSAVFLTESTTEGFLNAAIKLVPAQPGIADVQLWKWKTAATFSHPNLIRLLDSGQCEIAGRLLLFVVMEYAEETLSQVLPIRALHSDEVRELLVPTLDALAFLHREGWIQGQVKPSNFLVVDDQLKLALDTVRPVGVVREELVHLTPYDPPEAERGETPVAADVWGLAVTLVEALTQYPPTWPNGRSEPPIFSTDLPASFAATIQRCLSVNPNDRPTVAELQLQTRPASALQQVAPTAGEESRGPGSDRGSAQQSRGGRIEPTRGDIPPPDRTGIQPYPSSVELDRQTPELHRSGAESLRSGTESARDGAEFERGGAGSAGGATSALSGLSSPEGDLAAARDPIASPPSPTIDIAPRGNESMRTGQGLSGPALTSSHPSYSDDSESDKRRLAAPAMAAIVVVFLAVWGGSRILHGRSHTAAPPPAAPQTNENAATPPSRTATGAVLPTPATVPVPPTAAMQPEARTYQHAAGKSSQQATGEPSGPSGRRRPAGQPTSSQQLPRHQTSTGSGTERSASYSGAVVHEEVPKVPSSARQTIHGHVKVAVRVTVDRSGKVVGDSFESASSSKYFNRLASEAARKWKFAAADNDGAREWLLHFEFGREGTTVHATPERS